MRSATTTVAACTAAVALLSACGGGSSSEGFFPATPTLAASASGSALASLPAPPSDAPFSMAPTGPVSESEAMAGPVVTAPAYGTGGKLVPIQSDNVTAAGYDAPTATMTVQFDSGEVYAYSPVPLTVWKNFIAAQPHPWSAVGKPQLVDAGVPYRKIS